MTSVARRCCCDGAQGRLPGRRSPPRSRRLADDEARQAANRLAKLGVLAPEGVDWALAVANRNFIIHQYDEINRGITWQTLSVDLPAWEDSLQLLFADADADAELDDEAGSPATTPGPPD